MTHKLLTDTRFVRLSLDEGVSAADGKIRVKGEFAKCGIATENKRIYPETVWSKEIGRLGKAMTDRRVFGEMDHPADGRTSLNRASHIVTMLKVGKDGLVVGEAEILPTESGKNLAALLASGCKVGVSSRGYGSTKSNDKGEEVVQPDYKLVTFDFVAEPADNDAYPEVQAESRQNFVFEGVEMTAAEKKSEAEKAIEFGRRIEAERDAKNGTTATEPKAEDLGKNVLGDLSKLKAEIREQVKAELMADPAVASSKTVIEQLKSMLRPFMIEGDAKSVIESKDAEIVTLKNQLAEQELRVKTLEDDKTKLVGIAKEAGFNFWMEKSLANEPDGVLIRKLAGDVKTYNGLADLQAKVESIKKDFADKRAAEAKVVEERRAEIEKATKVSEDARVKAESRATELEKQLQEELVKEKGLALKLYAEQRLRNHPDAKILRPLVETAAFESKEKIDDFFNQKREVAKDADEMDAVRARVRKLTNGGAEDAPLSEDTNRPERTGNYNNLGSDLTELKKLSGIQARQSQK